MGSLPLSKRAQDCVLVFSFLFARDYCPCFLLFVCKGLLTLFPAICLQITAALFHRYMFVKDCALISCYSLAEDCGPCFRFSLTKDWGPWFLLFICKRLWSLSSAIHLQGTAVLVFAIQDRGPCYLFVCK